MVEKDFDSFVAQLMKNPKFKEEYEALKPEFDAARATMDTEQREPIAARQCPNTHASVSAAQ